MSYFEILKKHLDSVSVPSDTDQLISNKHLELSKHFKLTDEVLDASEDAPCDPLADAFSLITDSLNANYIDNIKLGANELLKAYLRKLKQDNQVNCTSLFLPRIKYIFLFSLLPSFPYRENLWKHLCKCLQPTGFYLLDKQLNEGGILFFDYVASMGKIAAKEGLPTGNLQQFLRMAELRSLEYGLDQLAGHVKNHRHNLEI